MLVLFGILLLVFGIATFLTMDRFAGISLACIFIGILLVFSRPNRLNNDDSHYSGSFTFDSDNGKDDSDNRLNNDDSHSGFLISGNGNDDSNSSCDDNSNGGGCDGGGNGSGD